MSVLTRGLTKHRVYIYIHGIWSYKMSFICSTVHSHRYYLNFIKGVSATWTCF